MIIVSNFFARCIARELQPDAAGWESLTAGTGQSRDSILWQNSMPLAAFNQLLSNALALSADPAFGLKFGRHANVLSLGEAGLASVAAPTITAILQALATFVRLQADYITLETEVGLKQLSIRGREHQDMGATRRTQHEVLILTLQNSIEMVLGRPLTEARFYFAFPQPDYHGDYASYYHSPFQFDAPATGIDLPRQLAEFPSPYYDQALWERGKSRCLYLMQQLQAGDKKPYSQHVKMALRSRQPPLPGASVVANEMQLSLRTFNRRLAQEGSSFRLLQHQVLQEWAGHYLSETALSVDAIAEQLGYQDSANFRRAFKRWMGCSPGEYRDQRKRKNVIHK
jgi:AraC-like DNA-binding protein